VDLLTSQSSPTIHSTANTTLDALHSQSTLLQSAVDDLVVATLYPSERPGNLSSAIGTLTNVLTALQSIVREMLPERSLDTALADMKVAEVKTDAKQDEKTDKNPRKWFDMCFQQLHRLADTARTISSQNKTSPP
jgi:exonuclease III